MKLETLLSNHYNIQIATLDIKPFGSGLVSRTWKVESRSQQFILQQINESVFKIPDSIDENINLIGDYLSHHAPTYIFTRPIRDIFGHTLVHYENHFFRLFDFIKNSISYDVVSSADLAYQAAEQFGWFTSLLSKFDSRQLKITIPDFHNLSLRYDQFNQAVKTGNPKRIHQADQIIKKINSFNTFIDTYKNIIHQHWTPRVIHHDTKISNVLFVDHKSYCIIDLDTVMPGMYISDVGDMMRTYLPTVSENESDLNKLHIQSEYFEAIANGYLSKMKDLLHVDEMHAFLFSGPCMIYMQALRFCTDFLNDDIYYGAKFEDQNLMRANNQVQLLIEYNKHMHDFKKIINKISKA